jgi:prepilin signal peptidase PulO-like enzyme (type II secretory pathway)
MTPAEEVARAAFILIWVFAVMGIVGLISLFAGIIIQAVGDFEAALLPYIIALVLIFVGVAGVIYNIDRHLAPGVYVDYYQREVIQSD